MPRSEARRRASGVTTVPLASFAGPKLRSGVRTAWNGSIGGAGRGIGVECIGAAATAGAGRGGGAGAFGGAVGAGAGLAAAPAPPITATTAPTFATSPTPKTNFRERSACRRRHFHRGLVGFDLEQVIARLYRVAGSLEPFRDLAFGDGFAELRHQNVHAATLLSSPRRRGPIRRALSIDCGLWVPALAELSSGRASRGQLARPGRRKKYHHVTDTYCVS